MRRAKSGFFVKLILLAFFVYASTQIIDLQIQIQGKKNEIETLTAENEQLTAENESMEGDLANGLTDEQVEKIAREKLGLANPDETVFVGITG